MPYEPIVPEGQHLGTSHEVDDAVTGHLFEDGSNELKGHAAWRRVDEPEEDYSSSDEHEPPRQLTPEELEALAKIVELILAGIVWAVAEGTPRFKRWWNGKAAPTVKAVWKRVTALRNVSSQVDAAASSSASRATFVASATGMGVAVAESKISMSVAEWEHHFRAMLAAGAFRDQQLRILSNARIEDGDAALEVRSTMEQLTPQQFVDRIKLRLEANPSLLDEENSAELVRAFSVRSKPSNDPGRPTLE